jgi:cytochrome P450
MTRRFSELRPKGRADLVRDLTPYNAYDITGGIIGFDPEDIAYVATCLTDAHAANVDPKRGRAGIDAQRAYAKELIDARRAAPRDDLVSSMINSEVDGHPITDEYLIGLVNMLLGGGIDTIYKQSGNIVALLIDHPDQFDLLRANRELIPRFVDESLRYEGVACMFARQATQESTLLGTLIPKDAIVFGMNGVVNRDPDRWSDPHRLDVMREPKPHMQFSSGAHSCLGALVARRALSVFIEHLIDDLPNLRWDPSKPHPRITGWHFRSPLRLPVLWDPVSPL